MTLSINRSTKQRAFAKHTPKWQRFNQTLIVPSTESASKRGIQQQQLQHPYQRQYSHVYHQRLAALKPRCWQSYQNELQKKKNDKNENDDNVVKVERILELQEEVSSVVVGTLVKEDGTDGELLHPKSKCKTKQSLFLEDASGRVALNMDDIHQYCTGMIVAIQGVVQTNGILKVQQVFLPALPPNPTIVTPSNDNNDNNNNEVLADGSPHLLLVSGLNCGNPNQSSLQRDMLLSFVRGHFSQMAGAEISRVIIAGGSTIVNLDHPTVGVKELDTFCVQLGASGIGIDILPGKDDPTTANWPQRPLHRSLLQFSDRYISHLMNRTPNPYASVHANKYILGTDGTNIHDLTKSLLATKITESTDNEGCSNNNRTPIRELEALRQTLKCGHICPTGPDSVPTMPHPETDCLVIPETPHIYFAGNCDTFDTELFDDGNVKCRLICIPKFSETGEAVVVNLETLQVKVVRFEDPQEN